MTLRKLITFQIAFIVVVVVATVLLYPRLPASIPTHWSLHLDRPDGFMPKWCALVIGPGLLTAICALTRILAWASPHGYQVDGAQSSYRRIMLIAFCIWLLFYGAILWAALGSPARAGIVIGIGYCTGLTLIGNVLGKLKRNFFIGVITPWTITSERVWYATHRLAAWLWVSCGITALALLLTGFPVGAGLLLIAGWYGPKLYSLALYKRLDRRGELSVNPSVESEAKSSGNIDR